MTEVTLALNYEGLEFEVTYEPDENGQPRLGWYLQSQIIHDLIFDCYTSKSYTQAKIQEFIRAKISENCRKEERDMKDSCEHNFKQLHYEIGLGSGMIHRCTKCGEDRVAVGGYLPPDCPIVQSNRHIRFMERLSKKTD